MTNTSANVGSQVDGNSSKLSSTVQGPAWNNTSEYPSLQAKEFMDELNLVKSQLQQLETQSLKLQPRLKDLLENQNVAHRNATLNELISTMKLAQTSVVLLWNLSVYVSCELSNDAQNADAKAMRATLTPLSVKLDEARSPLWLFLVKCDAASAQLFLKDEQLSAMEFQLNFARQEKDTRLSDTEELMLTSLGQSGHHAWAQLWTSISGTLKCQVADQEMGLGQASGLIRSGDEALRKEAWLAINQAWGTQEESAAAVINSLVGWRLAVAKKRSHTKKCDFLTEPLRQNKIERETLEAMMTVVEQSIPLARKAMTLMAKVSRKPLLDQWDLLAPCPVDVGQAIPYDVGFKQVRDAFASADPSMADFVDLMNQNGWIEGRVLPNKGPGAYCTKFAKSRTPRVFQTYMGSPNDISTLAHELGHAYHNWVMRDMPFEKTFYPMTLAETASIFAETVLAETQMDASTDLQQKMQIAWADAADAVGMLLNIPMRFEFEQRLNQRREERELSAKELGALMVACSEKWYGPSVAQHDERFWASKMHFHFSGRSFYNFPYTFGYLFSLSIYGRRKTLGADFFESYNSILRDTGSMTAEDLIGKHLGEDIRKPAFWQKSIEVVRSKIDAFERLSFQLNQ